MRQRGVGGDRPVRLLGHRAVAGDGAVGLNVTGAQAGAQVVGRVVVETVEVSEGTWLLAGTARQGLVSVRQCRQRVERTRGDNISNLSHPRPGFYKVIAVRVR